MQKFSRKVLILLSLLLVGTNQIAQASNAPASITEESAQDGKPATYKEFSSAELVTSFITTLFEPFIDEGAQSFYRDQIQQIKQDGTGYLWDKIKRSYQAIKSHPLDAASLATGVIFGHYPDLAEFAPIIPTIIGTLNNTRTSFSWLSFAKSIDGTTITNKGIKLVVAGGAVYLAASIPVASALEWNNLAAAKAHYNGGACPKKPWDTVMTPASSCLKEGKGLEVCRILIPADVKQDLYVFTRHPSSNAGIDPVSIVRLDDGKTCIQTALTQDSAVTEICFPNLQDPSTRTVKIIENLKLSKAHEGLKPGESVQHIGLHLKGTGFGGEERSCGTFHDASADYNLGEQPICLLTAQNPGEDVTQVCFNPKHPEAITVKKAEEGISLEFTADGKPVSLLIKNPKKMGIDINPDRPEGSAACPTKPGFSLWEALGWWWNQKTPCAEIQPEQKKEL